MIEVLLFAVAILVIINILITLLKKSGQELSPAVKNLETAVMKFDTVLTRIEASIKDDFQRNREETSENLKDNREELSKTINSFEEKLSNNIKGMGDLLKSRFDDYSKQQIDTNRNFLDSVKDVRTTIDTNLKEIREDNNKQLNEMRQTVDEKLQTTLEKRLGESFKQVSDRLEQVNKGLGEMQTIAIGVGDLKKVLSNVKTRGVLGEYQLENILEQILTPDQYAKNVATKKGSQANVEFAIKMPGEKIGKEVWIPIDSKFPIEDYNLLIEAYENGDKDKIDYAVKILLKKIESFAKTISEKYIDPPHTTDFAIMFLPIESLFAEVLRHPGLYETLQRKYKIAITGPTNLSAFLSSLQMGFRTLAVQKRSSEVWDILKAIKFEFAEFSNVLATAHKQINTASGTLEKLRTTRTNKMNIKLKEVESITSLKSKEILEISDDDLLIADIQDQDVVIEEIE